MSGEVTIVSVAYNSLAVLPQMLASVPEGCPVVVVDNASTDGAALAGLCESHGAKSIRNPQNRGFGMACNQGAAVATTEFLLFLNPDAQLGDGALEALVAAARRYPKAVAMNPRISNDGGKAYFKRRSVLMDRADFMPRGWPAGDQEVSVLSGSALFVRRADFEAVGGFDPAIFLYHEDDDLSRRLLAERGALMFIHGAQVKHMGGQSNLRSPASAAFKAWHMARSRVYTMKKHGRALPFVGSLFFAIGGLLAPDMLFSSRRRAKNWAFFKGTLSTRRDGGVAERTS